MSNLAKPETVKTAIKLLYIGLALGIIEAFLKFPMTREIASTQEAQALGGLGFALTIQFITFVSLALIIWLISKRKNWARWIFSILAILGIPMMIDSILSDLNNAPIYAIISIIQTLIQLAAIILLFLKPSREWFKKPKTIKE